MEKIFVLDTNVLLHDPNSLTAFEDNKIVLPIYVIEEIDNFKKEQTELGRNARQVSRLLEELRQKGSLIDGVSNGLGIIQVKTSKHPIPDEFVAIDRGADSKILAVALETKLSSSCPVVFITKDINLRIRASALGIESENYETEGTSVSEIYSGTYNIEVESSILEILFAEKEAPLIKLDVEPNSFGVLTAGKQSALVRFYPAEGKMKLLSKRNVWGIKDKNKEQAFALELLLDDTVPLVTLLGIAGSGKTILSLAAGLQKVAEEKKYNRMLVSRPVLPLGKDIGFLPGEISEKVRPWMQPIYDNLEVLMGIPNKDKKKNRSAEELFELGLIEVEVLTYIRGRSIPRQFILLDEAQNATNHIIKTLITRAGEGTKIVLVGDNSQIDDPYLDPINNGLVHLINRFKGQSCYGHVTLSKGERSGLAEIAAALL